MKFTKRILAIILSIIILVGAMPMTAMDAFAAETVTLGNTTATVLTGNETKLTEGYYVAKRNITYHSDLAISGNVTIVTGYDVRNRTLVLYSIKFADNQYGIVKADETEAAALTINCSGGYSENTVNFSAKSIEADTLLVNSSHISIRDEISVDSLRLTNKSHVDLQNTLTANRVETDAGCSVSAGVFQSTAENVSIKGSFSCVNADNLAVDDLNITYSSSGDRFYFGTLGDGVTQVSTNNGQVFTDGENYYSGSISPADIAGKTLKPAKSTVTYSSRGNGTVSGVSEAMQGEEVKLTVTPDEGYQLYSLVYEEENGNQVAISNNKFSMPAGSVEVKAVFIDNNEEEYLDEYNYTVTVRTTSLSGGSIAYRFDLDSWNSASLDVFTVKKLDTLNQSSHDTKRTYSDIHKNLCGYYSAFETSFQSKEFFKDLKLYVDFGGGLTHYEWKGKITVKINGTVVLEKDVETSSNWLDSSDATFTASLPDDKRYKPEKIKYVVKSADSDTTSLDKTLYQGKSDTEGSITGTAYVYAADQYGVYWRDWDGASLVSTSHPENDTATYMGTEGNASVWKVTSDYGRDHKSLMNFKLKRLYYDEAYDLDLNFVYLQDIIYSKTQNGTVKGPKTSTKGKEVQLTVTPNEGYELDTLTVTDESGNDISVTDDYAFIMPESKVTVAATFKVCPHYYGEPVCSWFYYNNEPNMANFTFTCTNPYCNHEEYVTQGEIIEQDTRDKVFYVATIEFQGKTYTDKQVKYEKVLSTVTVNESTHGSVTADLSEAYEDETVTLTSTAEDGYRLRAVTVTDKDGNNIKVKDGKFIMPASDVTVTAEFAKVYSITYLTLSHGSISGVTSAVSGEKIRVTAVPEHGYALDVVSVQNAQGDTYPVDKTTFEMPECNVFVLANFTTGTAIKYIAENGTVSGLNYAHEGDEIALTVTPDEGYRLVSLSAVDNDSNTITITDNKFTMAAVPVTVTAVFEPIPQYTVKWSSGGSILETDRDVYEGTMPEYNGAEPDAFVDEEGVEYVFAGWTPAIAPVTADVTYKALYAQSGRYLTSYLDENGETQTVLATAVTADTTDMTDTWYVVKENTTNNNRLMASGDTNLILADGAKLTAPKGIGVIGENSLTVFEQTNKTGVLLINGVEDFNAAIGGIDSVNSGNIIINGGTITVTGGKGAAAIGGGAYAGGSITINGGTVTATGGEAAAAIGGGFNSEDTEVVINGGTITATGGYQSAGIGGGHEAKGTTSVVVTGGNISAKGMAYAAAIGGSYGTAADVTITGGTVSALGSGGYFGIGGGYNTDEAESSIMLTYIDDVAIYSSGYHGKLTLGKDFTDNNHVAFYAGEVEDNTTVARNWLMPYTLGTITYAETENGFVSGPTTAYYGDEITLNIEPNRYYHVSNIEVKDQYGRRVSVDGNTFIMPAVSVTVSVSFFENIRTSRYLDKNGEEQTVVARYLTGTEDVLEGGWYIVDKNITFAEAPFIYDEDGEVNIILGDNVTMNIPADDKLHSANIYWQRGKTGALNASFDADYLNIYGGNINADSVELIGFTQTLNVYDGVVNIKNANCRTTNIYGGNFNVSGTWNGRELLLGYTNLDDSIFIKSFDGTTVARVVEGKVLTDGEHSFDGNIVSDEMENKTLTPYIAHSISYSNSENGKVEGPKATSEGETVTLTVKPNSGYILDTLAVKDADENNIDVTNNTFTMPESDVTVTATFKEEKSYTVEWIIGGQVVETDEDVPEGTMPEYNGEINYAYFDETGKEYVFAGWDPEITAVTDDAAYTALYEESGRISVKYLDENRNVKTVVATVLTGSEETLTEGWYIVNGDIQFSSNIKLSGVVNLILGENATMSSDKSFTYADSNTPFALNVFRQSGRSGTLNMPSGTNVILDMNVYGGNVNLGVVIAKTAAIYGGKFSARSLAAVEDGVITLGCNTESSNITVGSYTGNVMIASGQFLTDQQAVYSGTLTDAQRSAIANKTLFKAPYLTVEWIVDGKTVETDEDVLYLTMPEYNGETPADTFDDEGHKRFFGWSDGENEYAANELPAVTANVTYTAVYTETPHTYDAPNWTWADDYSSAIAIFTCTEERCQYQKTVNAIVTSEDKDGKRTYTATVELDGETYTDVQETEIQKTANDIYNLTVQENIDINILVDVRGHLADGEEIEKIVYTYPDITTQDKKTVTETVQGADIETDASGYFAKSFTMAIAQANEPITATIYFTNGTTKDITVSVAAYCEYIIANAEANNYPAKLVNLCYAVLDYGKNAADYFNYSYDAYPEYTLPSNFDAEPEIASQAGIKKGSVVTGIASTQMFILSKATMRLTFKDDLSNVEVVSAKIGDKALAAEKVKNNGKDAVDISGIYATELCKPIVLEFSDGTKVQYAATDWAKSILAYSTSDSSKALAKSLYYYSKAANDYFA